MGESAHAIAIVHQRRFPRRSSRSRAGRPERPRAKRQRFFRPVSRRKTAAFDLTTLWCCAVGTTFGAGSIFDVATDAVPICCSRGASPAPRRSQDAADISARVRDDSPPGFRAWQGQLPDFRDNLRDNLFSTTHCWPYTYRAGEVAERPKAAVC